MGKYNFDAIIDRHHTSCEKWDFLKDKFGRDDLLAMKKANPARHLAASFAAREAFAKAAGLDFFKVVLQGMWLHRTPEGPVPCFSANIEQWMDEQKLKVHISLSHDGDYAIAFIIVEVSSHDRSL